MTGTIGELSVFESVRPAREGGLALERQGMAPIPEDARYGGTWRMFTIWFTPNMELSGVFAGTLAVTVGLGFGLGLVAIIARTVIGSVPAAILCTWGTEDVHRTAFPNGSRASGSSGCRRLPGTRPRDNPWRARPDRQSSSGRSRNSMNDYTGSLAFQALGARARRPVAAALVAVLAFAAILWMHAGDTSARFENLLLFIGYWIAPFCAIVMIDWHHNRQRYTPSFLRSKLMFSRLGSGWPRSWPSCWATAPWCRS